MITEYDKVMICSAFITAIEYGDYSALTDNDIQQLEIFLESMPEGHKTYQYSDSTEFAKDEVSGLMADCVECTIFMDDACFSYHADGSQA